MITLEDGKKSKRLAAQSKLQEIKPIQTKPAKRQTLFALPKYKTQKKLKR